MRAYHILPRILQLGLSVRQILKCHQDVSLISHRLFALLRAGSENTASLKDKTELIGDNMTADKVHQPPETQPAWGSFVLQKRYKDPMTLKTVLDDKYGEGNYRVTVCFHFSRSGQSTRG